jgi:hypothetical protein
VAVCKHGHPLYHKNQECHFDSMFGHCASWLDEPIQSEVVVPNKSLKFFPPVAGTEPAVSVLNSKSQEPAVNVGFATSTFIGVLLGLGNLFPDLFNQSWMQWVVLFVVLLAPLIAGIITRQKVWSPASVLDAVEEGIAEARKYQK